MSMEVNLRQWSSELADHVRQHPRRVPLYFLFTAYLSAWYGVTSRSPFGTNVFESDWDLLVVLDACRVDTLREVADEYTFIETVDTRWSIGSQSAEWMANTFSESHREQVNNTTYISGNGYSGVVLRDHHYPPVNNTIPIDLCSWSVLGEDELNLHIPVWETHHDEKYSAVLPQVITDHTIEEGRLGSANRIIAHYTQPHLPYIGSAYQDKREPTEVERHGYRLLEQRVASRREVYDAYKETLRWVLDDVEELLENIDAEKIVITSDHGEAFGEWKAYGHPEGFPHPVVRKVPWVETTAKDKHTREPDIELESDSVETDVAEHLRDLGYR